MPQKTGAPTKKSLTKRGSSLIKKAKNVSRKVVSFPVGKRPPKADGRRSVRGPDSNKAAIDSSGDRLRIKNLRKRARVDVNKKATDHKGGRLRVRSRRTVWVDGPSLHAFMFGNSK
jgi:hypothetical protein